MSARSVTTAPDSDPRPGSRPTTVAGGKAHWDALTTEALATGGLTVTQQANGYNPVTDDPTVRTAEPLPRPALVVQDFRSTAKAATTVDVAWEPVTNDNAATVTYRLRRNGSDVSGATALSVLTYHDTGLTTATTYTYTVSPLVNGVRGPESTPVVVTTS